MVAPVDRAPEFPYVEPELQVSSGAGPSHCEVEDSIFRFGSARNASSNKREERRWRKGRRRQISSRMLGGNGDAANDGDGLQVPEAAAQPLPDHGLLLLPSSSFGVLRCACAALLLASAGLGGGGEAGARNVVGIIDLDGAVGGSDAGRHGCGVPWRAAAPEDGGHE